MNNLLRLAGVALALASTFAFAQTLQPVPTPDLSRLPPERAKALAQQRADLDKFKAAQVGPPLAQAYADMGALYARNGFDDAAAVAFFDASQVVPTDGRWYYLRGVIARRLKHNDEARANFQAALDRDKVYTPIRYRLADTLVDSGDIAGARKVLEDAAVAFPNRAVTFSMLGDLAVQQKRWADAVTNYNKALAIEPKATALYVRLAQAYDGQSNASAAADARAKAGDVAPTLDDPLALGIAARSDAAGAGAARVEKAQALAREGRIPAARAMLTDILNREPGNAEALALSARINAATGNIAIARAEIDQAVKSANDNAQVMFTSGLVAEYAGDEHTALDDYKQAQRLDRKLPDTWLMLGNAAMRHQKYDDAIDQYRGLVRLLPNTPEAYAHLAAAQVAQGNCGDALKDVNRALGKHSNDGDFMQLFVRIASTCKDAGTQEKDMALDYAGVLYKQRPDADNSSAFALAQAAHGKFKEAQEYQAEAIFEATRARDGVALAGYKATMQQFVKQQVPDRPWAPTHPYFTGAMLVAPQLQAAPAK